MAYKTTKAGVKINKYGIRIRKSQQEELKSLVKTANRQRQTIINKYSKQRKEDLKVVKNAINKSGDFVLGKKSADFSRFRSQEQLKEYISDLRRITSKSYIAHRRVQYKENLVKSLKTKFGSDADALIDRIDNLTTKEVQDLTLGDKLHSIGWLYNEPIKDSNKFNIINNQINKIIAKRKQ